MTRPAIYLRATGWPCEVVGVGDRETGICRVRLVGGPDDGREIDGVHYSEIGGKGPDIAAAFYGHEATDRAIRERRYWHKRGSRVRRERRQREAAERKK